MRLSFGCDGETDGALTESVIISPGEGENMEEKLQECLLQLEKVRFITRLITAVSPIYLAGCL